MTRDSADRDDGRNAVQDASPSLWVGCWQCGQTHDLQRDPNIGEVSFCRPCLRRFGEEPFSSENLGSG